MIYGQVLTTLKSTCFVPSDQASKALSYLAYMFTVRTNSNCQHYCSNGGMFSRSDALTLVRPRPDLMRMATPTPAEGIVLRLFPTLLSPVLISSRFFLPSDRLLSREDLITLRHSRWRHFSAGVFRCQSRF